MAKKRPKFKIGDWVEVLSDDFEQIPINSVHQIANTNKAVPSRNIKKTYGILDLNGYCWPYYEDELKPSFKHKNIKKVNKYLGVK